MKKLVTLLLSLALVLSLAACGGEATPDASDDAPASSQNEESTENDNRVCGKNYRNRPR